jgi:2,3-bisphosphoglycerate-independent phosphoglycerate mutase
MPEPENTPLVLIIRDGWGRNPNSSHDAFNAVKLANTPADDMLQRDWPSTLIATSGEDVGLTEGTMGNSEVGHQNIGAGRIVDQDAVRITKACREGKLKEIPALTEAITGARDAGRTVHLMGICSDAGVHGQLEHLYALLRLCKDLDARDVALHLFTDGRDTGPFSGAEFIAQIEQVLSELGIGRIVSVIGRYWAMDRDNRWERVQTAYECLTGRGVEGATVGLSPTADDAVRAYYEEPSGETMRGDEFVSPTMIGESIEAAMASRISDGDAVIYYNYRGDRPRELCSAFLLPEFDGSSELEPSPDSGRRGFERGKRLDLRFVLMTPYSERLAELAPVAFPKPPKMVNIGGAYLASLGLTQFRCAETEKFPHVTFFFNDYRDEPFEGEHRKIIQSPRVATYDMKPEMSAAGVCDAVLGRLFAEDCEDMLIVNFANGDMVGHTGNLEAAVRACEVVDECVGKIVEATRARGGSLIVTADHGNAEQMWNPETNAPHTAHTTFRVPLHVVGEAFRGRTLRESGRLADIFPTALDMMGLEQPAEMTGRSLLA